MELIQYFKKDPFRLVFVILFLATTIHYHNAGDKVAGDGYSYFLYSRNLFFYGDLKLHDVDKQIQNQRFINETHSGTIRNPFSVGPAIFWLPFYGLAHAIITIESLWTHYTPNGFEHVYREYVGIGTIIYVFIGLWLLYLFLLKNHVSRLFAGLAVVSGYLGTFLINYTVFEPSMAHGISFFLISLFLFLWFIYQDEMTFWRIVLVGAVLGLAGLVRYTNMVFIIIPILSLSAHMNLKKLRELAGLTISAFALFFIQMWTWKITQGSFLTVPQGQHFMQWAEPKLLETLFAKGHGFLSSQFIIPLGLLGYFISVWRRKLEVVGLMIVVGLLLYINASAYDWYAGHSFGNRRFEALIPIVILGLPTIMERLSAAFRVWGRTVVILLFSALMVYNLFYLDYYRKNSNQRDRVITPASVFSHIYQETGSLLNIPLNAYLALRYSIPLGKAESLLGNYPKDGYIYPIIDDDYLLNGWDPTISKEDGELVRKFKHHEARIAFPVLHQTDITITIRLILVPPIEPGELHIQFNTMKVNSEKLDSSKTISFRVERNRLQQPFNILKFDGNLQNVIVEWIRIIHND